jgi:glycosyltransferase involved in cell wall biosynthesis
MRKKMVQLSVILVNKNRQHALEKSIGAILRQLQPEDEFIVIDDHSEDESVEIIKKYQDRITHIVLFNSYGNRAKCRNHAASFATREVIAYVDADVMIGPENLKFVRELHEDIGVAGTIGNVFSYEHDDRQFEFLTGMKTEEFINSFENNFRFLAKYDSFFDSSYFDPSLTEDEATNWQFYFTYFATTRKDLFDKIGRFDENFDKWGGEDMEFAYRLNKEGRIVVSDRIVSYHRPHARNVFHNEMTNTNNVYYILKKHVNFELELLAGMRHIPSPKIVNWIRQIFSELANNKKTEETRKLENKEAMLYFTDFNHAEGYMEYCLEGKMGSYELLGLALPFANETFDTIYISEYYSYLPESILALIFQEALRLSDKVLVPKNRAKIKKVPVEMMPKLNMLLVCFHALAIRCSLFDIQDYNEQYYRIRWKEGAQVRLFKKVTL